MNVYRMYTSMFQHLNTEIWRPPTINSNHSPTLDQSYDIIERELITKLLKYLILSLNYLKNSLSDYPKKEFEVPNDLKVHLGSPYSLLESELNGIWITDDCQCQGNICITPVWFSKWCAMLPCFLLNCLLFSRSSRCGKQDKSFLNISTFLNYLWKKFGHLSISNGVAPGSIHGIRINFVNRIPLINQRWSFIFRG